MTNGDRIRKMTDEELLEYMGVACRRCVEYNKGLGGCYEPELCCKEGNLAWIKQEFITPYNAEGDEP